MRSYDVPLHDIRDVQFAQATDWVTIGEAVVIVVVLLFVFRYVARRVKRDGVADYPKEFLDAVNLKDVRQRAYEITRIGAFLADKNELTRMRYDELCESLQEYKYKKTVSEFSAETNNACLRFLAAIDDKKDNK